jgi:predicted Zn-dependent protease
VFSACATNPATGRREFSPQTSFLHAGLRFALEFPQAWDVNNGRSQVVADPQANAFILMRLVQQPVERTVEEVALRSMQRAGFQPVEGSCRTINGLDAFVGTIADQPRPGERLRIVVRG